MTLLFSAVFLGNVKWCKGTQYDA